MKLLLSLLLLNALLIAQQPNQALFSLVASERAFAAATAHLGVRNGFLTFFADNALTFEPELGSYKDALKHRPQPSFPLRTLLRWAPEEGDVSSAGDLGYLTGPFTVESVPPDSGPISGGWYFSIWEKQPDSTWKVFIDVGIETPPHGIAIDSVQFRPAETYGIVAGGGSPAELASADSVLNGMLGEGALPHDAPVAPSVRLHRNGWFPIRGLEEGKRYLQMRPYGSATTLSATCASSGDLGYTYGEYSATKTSGYYVRVWKSDSEKCWRLVIEVTTERK